MKTFTDFGIDVPAGVSGEIDVVCPECSSGRKKSRDKCLSVNIEDGCWHCHHCGWAGGLGKETGPRPAKAYARPKYDPPLDADEVPSELAKWMARRGITIPTLVSEHIGLEAGFIHFPYYNMSEELVNVKRRALVTKDFFQTKGAERILYGVWRKPVTDTLVWVEGEMDRLSVLEAGHPDVVSVPDGAPGGKVGAKLDFFQSCEPFIRQFKTHIIAVDGDAPGARLEEELIRRLGAERCKTVRWPETCKDSNDVLVKFGPVRLRDVIDSSSFVPVEGIFSVKDIAPDLFRTYDVGYTRGVSTGWPTLDLHMQVSPSQFTVVTGIPSHGKSEFLDALVTHIAETEDWKFAIFSPENQPISKHVQKLAEKRVGKSFLPGSPNRMTEEELLEAAKWLNEHFYFVLPPEDKLTIDGVLELVEVLNFRHGIRGLVIDPWNEIDHSGRPAQMSETEYISQVLTKVRRFARSHRLHIWLVAHPTKLQRDRETGRYPVPDGYSISGSAAWRNKADNLFVVFRPDMLKDVTEVHVQKIRFKESGRLGMVRFGWDRMSGRFFELTAPLKKSPPTIAGSNKPTYIDGNQQREDEDDA